MAGWEWVIFTILYLAIGLVMVRWVRDSEPDVDDGEALIIMLLWPILVVATILSIIINRGRL